VIDFHARTHACACTASCREQRATDTSVEKCKKRYDIFKAHYGAAMRLKQFFPFHLIDAMGSLEETHEAISLELRCVVECCTRWRVHARFTFDIKCACTP
jgi:hypothetical protein